jgi:hypothetical protein
MRVFWYTMAGIGVSFVVFVGIRMAAKPGATTMNKEWQEATNEYLKVSQTINPRMQSADYLRLRVFTLLLTLLSPKTRNLSLVSRPKTTMVLVWFRVNQRSPNSYKVLHMYSRRCYIWGPRPNRVARLEVEQGMGESLPVQRRTQFISSYVTVSIHPSLTLLLRSWPLHLGRAKSTRTTVEPDSLDTC